MPCRPNRADLAPLVWVPSLDAARCAADGLAIGRSRTRRHPATRGWVGVEGHGRQDGPRSIVSFGTVLEVRPPRSCASPGLPCRPALRPDPWPERRRAG
jgi:hypothetical protein